MSSPITYLALGQGVPLLFLHGIGGAAVCWEPQLRAFSERHRAIAWDMPGYGGSEPLAEMTFAGLAGALVGLLDRLEIARAYLVGHSMGGMVAQEVVAGWPERVDGLALVATSAAFGRADGAWQQSFLARRIGPLDRGRSMAELAGEVVAELVGDTPEPKGVALAIRSMGEVPQATYRAALHCLLAFDRRAALARIRVPTLLLAGERDRVAPPAVMARMAAMIPGARLGVLPRAGHLVNLEQPAAFNRALAAFLTRPPEEEVAGAR